MTRVTGAKIVVGVDGSESSLSAVRAAARAAADRGRQLRVVHAFIWPALNVATGPAVDGPPESGLRHQAEQMLDEAVAEAQKVAPDLPVSAALVDGAAVPVLLRESHQAALLVLGDRGLGGFSGLLIGSVAVQAAAHAGCPVLVVRGTLSDTGPVLLGVDGSEHSSLAVGFAVEEAARRGAELLVVHTWRHPLSTGPGDMLPLVYDPTALEEEARLVLSESLAGWSQRYPEVTVRTELVRGRPGPTLVERSRTAQLVVVGARGRGGFAGLLLGSVSQTLLHHSSCSVAVIRGTLPIA